MASLGNVGIGGGVPVRIMGILNTSPESFYKGSIQATKSRIKDAVERMENDGADIIDVGGMSTAPYLSATVSERVESERVQGAVKVIQNASNMPISVDTCRAGVAKDALESGVEIINDISGLKYDPRMRDVVSEHGSSLVLCAYGRETVTGNAASTRKLLGESLGIASKSGISPEKIVLDPAIGFFRRTGKNPFFTKTESDWVKRDLSVIKDLGSIKQHYPILVSVSNKSFIGELLGKEDPADRIFGSIAAEVVSVMNGADVIRTHNVGATRDAIAIASKLLKRTRSPASVSQP